MKHHFPHTNELVFSVQKTIQDYFYFAQKWSNLSNTEVINWSKTFLEE